MKKLFIFVASILLVGATFKERPKVQQTKTIEVIEQDFHDDFDSTYYYYGCQYNTFKLNHKCK